jgi:hypothetical protein
VSTRCPALCSPAPFHARPASANTAAPIADHSVGVPVSVDALLDGQQGSALAALEAQGIAAQAGIAAELQRRGAVRVSVDVDIRRDHERRVAPLRNEVALPMR